MAQKHAIGTQHHVIACVQVCAEKVLFILRTLGKSAQIGGQGSRQKPSRLLEIIAEMDGRATSWSADDNGENFRFGRPWTRKLWTG